MFANLRQDLKVIFERDPAARSVIEVFLCYPGFHALRSHRVAHRLWRWGLRLPARVLSHLTRFLTGIEIHPGATIGPGVFIDHGMGVVIGETAEVGHDVTIYQGVTLGGTSHTKGKRHPTIGDCVVIGTGAKILGPLTVGAGSRIGAGSVVIRDVPPNATVVGIPGRVVSQDGRRVGSGGEADLDHNRLPDPVAHALHRLSERVTAMERELREARGAASGPAPAPGVKPAAEARPPRRREVDIEDSIPDSACAAARKDAE